MSSRRETVSPTAEQDFGKPTERGRAARFAREDHTHGTPIDPTTSLLSNILGTANKITITDNGDGTITITLSSSVQLDGSTASRLLATDANKKTVSADLAAWVAGTADQITITDDTDGSVTLALAAAALAKLVTNGDSHDHSGGDGAAIDYANLASLPTLAAMAAKTTAGAPYTNDGYATLTIGGTSYKVMTTAG